MLKEVSSGIIPIMYIENSSDPLVFVLKHRNGLHWGFPKGHQEQKETYLQTASRELLEETGLNIDRVLSLKPLVQNYVYLKGFHKYKKTVFYFIALVKGFVSLQKEEILEGKWISFSEAISLFSFESSKKIASQAANFLKIIL